MAGVLLLFRWKKETEEVHLYTDINNTNVVQDVQGFLSGQRRHATSVSKIELSKLSMDAMEYLSNWAAYPTFHPHGGHCSECGCTVLWLPDMKLPTLVYTPGKQ